MGIRTGGNGMKYVYIPVLFTEIAKGLENKELKASNVYFETDKFNGVRSLQIQN